MLNSQFDEMMQSLKEYRLQVEVAESKIDLLNSELAECEKKIKDSAVIWCKGKNRNRRRAFFRKMMFKKGFKSPLKI